MEKSKHGLVQASVVHWQSFTRATRRRMTAAGVIVVVLILYLHRKSQWQSLGADRQVAYPDQHQSASAVFGTESFENVPVSGFANTKIPNGPSCGEVRVEGQQITVTQSFHLEDDLLRVAENLNHPMIDYTEQPKGLGFKETFRKTWGRMAGSSVWLEEQRVYFAVSRIFFYTKGVKHWPVISFVRAQVYDENWNHLDKFNIEWQGQNLTYPQVLSIPTYFKEGGGYYGPEDPRITIESGVKNAEPVIIFNMLKENSVRGMYMHRPFSNATVPLYIENEQPRGSEKNWSPFFTPRINATGHHDQRYPSTHINFVYDYHPLTVLRCHVMNGACQYVYKQDQPGTGWDPYTKDHKYPDTKGVLRGGTNFVPVPFESRPGISSFVGFPRTHTDAGCGKKDPFYRPIMTLLSTNDTHYWLEYASDYLNFGHAVLTPAQHDDPCDAGRILLGNGISRYEHEANRDVMTMSFTVADSTVQVAKVHGLRKLIQSLPQMQTNVAAGVLQEEVPWKLNVTHDLLICSIQSASDYIVAHTPAPEETTKAAEEKAGT